MTVPVLVDLEVEHRSSAPAERVFDATPLAIGSVTTLVHEQIPAEHAERAKGGWTKMLAGMNRTLG